RPASTVFYTLSLHDALPILGELVATVVHHLQPLVGQGGDLLEPSREDEGGQLHPQGVLPADAGGGVGQLRDLRGPGGERTDRGRSEEHTSELQSQSNLVCRL